MASVRSSRHNYREFLERYNKRLLDDDEETELLDASATAEEPGTGSPSHLRNVWGRGYLREYLQWLRPHRFQVVVVSALGLATTALEMIQPLFVRYIIDNALLGETSDASARVVTLNLVGAAFLTVCVLVAALGFLRNYRQQYLNLTIMLSLRRALFDRLLRLPLSKLHDMKTGGILSRLTGDIDSTAGLLQMAIISPSISMVRLLIAIGILIVLNWQLAVVGLALIPGALLMSFFWATRIRPIYRVIRDDVQRIDGRVGETFSGIRIVRAFRREARELLDYVRGRHGVVRKELFAYRLQLTLSTSWGFFISGISVVIVWYGGHLYLDGRATIGDIMAFQWYSLLMLNPVWQIVNSFSQLQRSLASTERVFEVLGMADDKPDRPDVIEAPSKVDKIVFENIEFEYREGRPVVRDFDVVVPGGSVVALVGRSGAGKTTVTDLVARFRDPTHGRILVNGTDLRQFRLRSYRGLLAIVEQDVFLFDGSVHENIAYSNRAATAAEVEDAARRANAHEFIVQLPEQYQTFVGERGVKLSGGQQQRLAIARAILADAQILILDEATSNLDTESEQLIQASMATLFAGRTTFVIAHRLSTVRRADLILLLEGGRIIERGTHETLMAAQGKYYEMVLRQMASDREGVEEKPILTQ